MVKAMGGNKSTEYQLFKAYVEYYVKGFIMKIQIQNTIEELLLAQIYLYGSLSGC